jgi:hypothetical protein
MPRRQFGTEIITAAIEGFEGQKKRIDEQIAELRAMLSGEPVETTADTPEVPAPGKRKKFSAASRRKMALAQKKRWAAIKGTSEKPEPATPEGPKAKRRKMSASARKAIGEATRARWAAKRASEASATKAPKKSVVKGAKKLAAKTKKAVRKAVKHSAPAVAAAAM